MVFGPGAAALWEVRTTSISPLKAVACAWVTVLDLGCRVTRTAISLNDFSNVEFKEVRVNVKGWMMLAVLSLVLGLSACQQQEDAQEGAEEPGTPPPMQEPGRQQ